MQDVRQKLENLIAEALRGLAEERGLSGEDLPEAFLERPRREGQGDWATNVAMQGTKIFREPPRKVAEALVRRIPTGTSSGIDKIEIAGPGFINFFLSSEWGHQVLSRILEEGENYGRCDLGQGRKVQVEFVSANPTGPLHVGHGRGAAVGDVTASLLEYAGWQVEREYYINDAGLQMEILGRSTQARYFEIGGNPEGAPFPENGYKGDYIYDLAREVMEEKGEAFLSLPLEESLEYFTAFAAGKVLDTIKRDLEQFGVRFDVWFSEKSLYEKDMVPSMIEHLKGRDYAYDKEGAVWFRSTAFGDEKDRVLIRSNGVPTYFASDIAYHKNKYDRGFDLVINVWGADHHGYVPRMKSAVEALGRNPEDLQIMLIQFVNLLRGGEPVAMSTRSGQFETLEDVLREVGVDATRYFFLMRRCDSHLDFDLELAKTASRDNPVYYVQYAHARICSIFREARERGVELPSLEECDLHLLSSSEEQNLIKQLGLFPEEVAKAAREFEPHRVVFYLYDLACAFHTFYNAHHILGETEELRKARLLLCRGVQRVLQNALGIVRIGAPEQM
ncbi:MAG TPA: arginine--tRNA ligase [Synergistaceae bacterium]|nr:arginine--tRNA ligase [Synergistaceae bacterium]HPQ37213.1 arginine--tRNA ligase [Synergistaceae bacterium]